MIEVLNVLFFLFYFITLLFLLAEIRLSRVPQRNRYLGCALLAVVVAINAACVMMLGILAYSRLFPLLFYVPGYGFLCIVSKYRRLKLLFAFLTVVLISALPPLLTLLILTFLSVGIVAQLMIRIALYIIIIWVVFAWYRHPFVDLLAHNDEGYALFCVIPVLLITICYVTYHFNLTMVTDVWNIITRLALNLAAQISYLMVFTVFRRNQDRNQMKNDQNIMKLQLDAAKEQIDRLREMEAQAKIYRHDMRHHFALIRAYLSDGKIEKAQNYIAEAAQNIGSFTPAHYCGNETANLIISHYVDRARLADVSVEVDANIPENLTLSDTELCSILSNGLENAIEAAAQAHNGKPIRLIGKMQGSKLLLRIQNPFSACVEFDGGLPKTAQGGHGLGVKSIASIADKHDGIYSFTAENGLFTFSLIV